MMKDKLKIISNTDVREELDILIEGLPIGTPRNSIKKDLAEVLVEKINPICKEMNKLAGDKVYLDSIMKKGKEKAIYVADSVLRKVYNAVGFY